MKLNRLILLLIIFNLGCSFFNKKVENLVDYDKKNQQLISLDLQSKKDYFCYDKNKLQLIVEDESANKYYAPLINKIFKNKKFNFYQKITALSILEMFRRPDMGLPII